jgi:dephospho-CoA kinase
MLVVGLTGGIGTGKSELARILSELGAAVIDADKVGHEVYAPQSQVWHEVVRVFGPQVLKADEEVDREKLGSIVFGDREKLARLNAITHPAIAQRIEARLRELKDQGTEVVVIEAILLAESPLAGLVDEVWMTLAPEEQVVERLARRSGLPPGEVRQRIDMQPSFSANAGSVDVVIENRGDLEELKNEVESLWKRRVKGRSEQA